MTNSIYEWMNVSPYMFSHYTVISLSSCVLAFYVYPLYVLTTYNIHVHSSNLTLLIQNISVSMNVQLLFDLIVLRSRNANPNNSLLSAQGIIAALYGLFC